MASLPIWGKFASDLSWLEKAGEQQEAIEAQIASEDLDKLLDEHPDGPAFLQLLLVAEVGNIAEQLQQVKEKALVGHTQVSEISEEMCSQLEDLVAEAKAEDPVESKGGLVRLRDEKLGDVAKRTRALGEVVDPEQSMSLEEALATKYGEEALAQMGPEKDAAAAAAHEELIAERILGHETAAYSSVQALLQASDPPPKLAEILSKADQLQAGKQQVDLADASKKEAQRLLDAVKQALVTQKAALAACESKKKARLEEGGRRRAALEKALRELQQADRDYRCWYVENEVYRLQIQRSKSSVARTEQEVAAAESEWPEANAACQAWLDIAVQEAETITGHETDAAKAAVEHAHDAIGAAALNALIGKELCKKIAGDKEEETASLEHEKMSLESEKNVLIAQLKEPCKDIRAKRTKLAQNKDKLSRLNAQIASCKQKHGEVKRTLADAQKRHDALKALCCYGLSIDEQELAGTAQQLCQEAYGHFRCFAGSQQPAEPEQPPSSDSGILATLPPDMKALFQQMLEEKVEEKMLQLRADLELRGGGVSGSGWAARSLGGSDAGDSSFNFIQDSGNAEHFAIASDAGSALGSSTRTGGEMDATTPMQGTNGGASRVDSDIRRNEGIH